MFLLTRILLVAALGLFFLTPASAQEANVPSAEAQQLIDLLENPEARDALIQSLRGAAETTTADEVVDPEEDTSIGRQLADFTKSFFETAATSIGSALSAVIALPTTLMALEGGQLDVLWEALQALAVVIVVTVGSYLLLRAGAKLIYRRMGDKAHDWGFVRTLAVVAATTLIDILVVLAAWGLGYLVALYLYGETGVIGVRQTLYLNAFLLVGLAKVALRAVLAPTTHELRFIAISDVAARRMSSWFGAIASVIGYGQLLIVPIVNRQASYAAGRGISTLLAFIAIGMAAILVVRSRKDVAGWILGPTPEERPSALRFIGRNWYIPVLLYLAGLAVIVAARPDGLILPLLLNSAQVIGIIVLGILLSGGLSRFAVRGMHMPMNVSSRMPTLEPRVNSLLGRVIQVVRVFIVIGVLAFALDAIGLWDISGFMRSEFGTWAAGAIVSIAFILLTGAILWLALVSWVDYRLNPEFGSAPTSREITLLTLLRNAATIALLVIILMFVLAELGVDIAPLIASAGVLLGISSSRGLAAELRDRVSASNGRLDPSVKDLKIKISGCFNSCGQHHVADIGFYGVSRKSDNHAVPHFQVVLGGQWTENAAAYGLAVAAVPSKRVPEAVERITDFYVAEREPEETFQAFIKRAGKAKIRTLLQDLTKVPAYAQDSSHYSDWGDPREYSLGDMGVGECAGEVVSLTEFGLASSERQVFEAQVELDNRDFAKASQTAFQAMLEAAKALVQVYNIDVINEEDQIVEEFRRRFYDTELFHDPYAGAKFANYLFHAANGGRADTSPAAVHRRIEEAQLFIEAAYSCYNRLGQRQLV